MLQALGSDQALDARSLGVGLLALALGLDLATDNVLADLLFPEKFRISLGSWLSDSTRTERWESPQL